MAKIKKLTREQIVHVAMEMFDNEGDAGFSMRKLAGKLGVDPMAIYHHHANRNALISEVVQAYLSQRRIPTRSGDWRVDIRELCQSLRGLAKSHPNIFRLYQAHDTWVPEESRISEAFHTILLDAGFESQTVVRGVRLLSNYTESFAVDELAGWYKPLDDSDRAQLAQTVSADTHPAMTRLMDDIGTADAEADFAFGLDVIVRGLEAELVGD